ncbi:MAG: TrkA family potassium uptake protein [Armatimonadetes bacterium]|nr:TrkA family potassium uptake protein [Armatimonadota bacterium]
MRLTRPKERSSEFAVIGLGRFGSSLALSLMSRGFHVLGADRNPDFVKGLADRLTQTVTIDSTNEDALREIGISDFDTVVIAMGQNFEGNVLTTVGCKNLGVKVVISKAQTERQRSILLKVGADRVVLPEHEAGHRLAQELIMPGILNEIPLGDQHSVSELQVPYSMVGRTLEQVDLRRRHKLAVMAVKRGEELIVTPPYEFVFNEGDLIVVIGSNRDIAFMARAL